MTDDDPYVRGAATLLASRGSTGPASSPAEPGETTLYDRCLEIG
jgi:hypothetical protein